MILTASYVLPIHEQYIEDGAVLVREGEIKEVGKRADLVAKYPGEEIKDYGQAALCPGFVDTHTHLEYTVFRGLVEDLPYSEWKSAVMELEGKLDDDDWNDSALLGALEALSSGITTIADITNTGASLRAVNAAGLRGIVYRELETMNKCNVDVVMDEAVKDIEEWESNLTHPERVSIGIAPHSVYSCHPSLFKKVAAYASDGRPVALHLAGSSEEYGFVKYGSSILKHDVREQYEKDAPLWLPTGVSPVRYVHQWDILKVPNILAAHCTQVDDDDVEILKKEDVAIAHCPRCNAKLGMGVAPLHKFLDAGIRIGLGTDSPAASNAMDVFEEMRVGLLIQRGQKGTRRFYTAQRFLKLATHDAASALKLLDKVGTLEVGKRADIIAVDLSESNQMPTHKPGSALVHTADQHHVMMTMVDGEILYENEEWKTLDAAQLSVRAEEMRKKLRV